MDHSTVFCILFQFFRTRREQKCWSVGWDFVYFVCDLFELLCCGCGTLSGPTSILGDLVDSQHGSPAISFHKAHMRRPKGLHALCLRCFAMFLKW